MDELVANSQFLPQEYKKLIRIRDMWSNNVDDADIRNVLEISPDEWKHLMTVLKTIMYTDGDNFIQFQKFKAKTDKRNRDLEQLRLYAEGEEEIGNALKCYQLAAEQDKSLVDVGLKLGVMKGEVIRVEGHFQHDVRLAALLQNVPEAKQEEVKNEINDLARLLMEEGVVLYDSKRTNDSNSS